MSDIVQSVVTPLLPVLYVFIAFVIVLYVLSVAYVFSDARRRGAGSHWGFVALVPFIGLLIYLAMRPSSYLIDRQEQELDMALRERQLAAYGTCPKCGTPIEKDFIVCPVCNTQVRNVCPTCHRPLEAHWKVCPYCRTHIQ